MAASGLLLGSPLLAAIAGAIRATMGRPVLFRQERLGHQGRPFQLVKFRTMQDRRGTTGALLPDADRLTVLGCRLRATSLDELPELWHVLRGEMSLVGPRPFMAQYGPLYTPEQARRHDVLPGITGWAQVNGRNANSWEERFAQDLWYVDHWSLRLDARILGCTLVHVLSRRGINFGGHATMPVYEGPAARDIAGVDP